QGVLAVHHAGAGLLAEPLHIRGGVVRHVSISRYQLSQAGRGPSLTPPPASREPPGCPGVGGGRWPTPAGRPAARRPTPRRPAARRPAPRRPAARRRRRALRRWAVRP